MTTSETPEQAFIKSRIEAAAFLEKALNAAKLSSAFTPMVETPIPSTREGVTNLASKVESLIACADRCEKACDYASALNQLDQAVGIDPGLPSIQGRRARLLSHLGQKREAVKAALSELAVRPDNEAAFGILISDKTSLIAELGESSPLIVDMVGRLIELYTNKYQQL